MNEIRRRADHPCSFKVAGIGKAGPSAHLIRCKRKELHESRQYDLLIVCAIGTFPGDGTNNNK